MPITAQRSRSLTQKFPCPQPYDTRSVADPFSFENHCGQQNHQLRTEKGNYWWHYKALVRLIVTMLHLSGAQILASQASLRYGMLIIKQAHLWSQVLTTYTVKLICYRTVKDHLNHLPAQYLVHCLRTFVTTSPTMEFYLSMMSKPIYQDDNGKLYHSSILDIWNFSILTKFIEGNSGIYNLSAQMSGTSTLKCLSTSNDLGNAHQTTGIFYCRST